MSRRAAIELTANFMVVLILGIVIFGMGLYLAYTMMGQAQGITDKLNNQQEAEIWNLLDNGNPVVAPIYQATLQPGKSATFGIGIRNIDTINNFKVSVIPDDVLNSGCVSSDPKNIIVVVSKTPRTINENDQATVGIGVGAGKQAKRCDYVLNVEVYRCSAYAQDCVPDPANDPQYYLTQKLYVKVV
jgi:hypothetical protein